MCVSVCIFTYVYFYIYIFCCCFVCCPIFVLRKKRCFLALLYFLET